MKNKQRTLSSIPSIKEAIEANGNWLETSRIMNREKIDRFLRHYPQYQEMDNALGYKVIAHYSLRESINSIQSSKQYRQYELKEQRPNFLSIKLNDKAFQTYHERALSDSVTCNHQYHYPQNAGDCPRELQSNFVFDVSTISQPATLWIRQNKETIQFFCSIARTWFLPFILLRFCLFLLHLEHEQTQEEESRYDVDKELKRDFPELYLSSFHYSR